MRARLLISAGLISFLCAPAVFAQQATPHDWSGAYVGASVGGATLGGVDFSFAAPFDTLGYPAHEDFAGTALSGTATLGVNLQQGAAIYGVEIDATALGKGAATHSDHDGFVVNKSGGLDSLFTLRGRYGIAVDQALLYGTAGLAAGNASMTTDLTYGASTASGLQMGFVAGAGIEYALTDQFSVKAEALYYRLASLSTAGAAYSGGYTATSMPAGALVRAGVNLHFK